MGVLTIDSHKRLFNVWSALDERLVSEQKSSIQQISSNSLG